MKSQLSTLGLISLTNVLSRQKNLIITSNNITFPEVKSRMNACQLSLLNKTIIC